MPAGRRSRLGCGVRLRNAQRGAVNIAVLLGTIIAVSGIALGFTFRKRKTAVEKERERRLKVNTIGRICDGSVERVSQETGAEPASAHLIHYSYSVGGVGYSAAQDITALLDHVRLESCIEGYPTSIKYDPQNPSNSIVICELWSGLRK